MASIAKIVTANYVVIKKVLIAIQQLGLFG
jgi:hypothetical protein